MRLAVLAVLAVAALAAVALAGCSTGADRPPLRAKATQLEVPESPEYPGLHVYGLLTGAGDALRIEATARNDGPNRYQVETGCSQPWKEVLFRGNDTVTMREPRAQCLAFSLMDLAPGDVRSFNVTWDGRVWDDEHGVLVRAEAGEYEWSVRFVAYQEEGVAAKRFDLDFPVTVL